MEDTNFVLLIVGFFAGYLIKGLFTFRSAWAASGILVEKVANQALKLLGTTVYKVSFMDQLYKQAIGMAKGTEDAKVCANELDHEFEVWKKETMQAFVEYYPEEYKWQLEATDWQSAMTTLTEIYKKEKTKDDGIPQEHNGK